MGHCLSMQATPVVEGKGWWVGAASLGAVLFSAALPAASLPVSR